MKKPDEDHIMIPRECEYGDLIKVYWVRNSGPVVVAGPDPMKQVLDDRYSDLFY